MIKYREFQKCYVKVSAVTFLFWNICHFWFDNEPINYFGSEKWLTKKGQIEKTEVKKEDRG